MRVVVEGVGVCAACLRWSTVVLLQCATAREICIKLRKELRSARMRIAGFLFALAVSLRLCFCICHVYCRVFVFAFVFALALVFGFVVVTCEYAVLHMQ